MEDARIFQNSLLPWKILLLGIKGLPTTFLRMAPMTAAVV